MERKGIENSKLFGSMAQPGLPLCKATLGTSFLKELRSFASADIRILIAAQLRITKCWVLPLWPRIEDLFN